MFNVGVKSIFTRVDNTMMLRPYENWKMFSVPARLIFRIHLSMNITEASMLNTSSILIFSMHPPYSDLAYEALGCLRHVSKLIKFVFNQHLTFHLLDVFDEENVRNIYIKKAPAHSFSIRNPDKKCFF